jgi:aminoglycoside phosphotransferase (APT) family kinase protein
MAAIHERLVDGTAGWSAALAAQPQTLIHNDFNPRNIAIRRAPAPDGRADGLRLCAYDWELATLGAPQRDLAELLCFVLTPATTRAEVARWLDAHREALAVATGRAVDADEWEHGFRAALGELLVDRLSMYAMVHRVRAQRFLPRVVRTWLALHRLFPWP